MFIIATLLFYPLSVMVKKIRLTKWSIWSKVNIWNFEKKISEKRNFQGFSLCGEPEINLKLSNSSRWSFISIPFIFHKNNAKQIKIYFGFHMEMSFKLISFFGNIQNYFIYKNRHDLSNAWRIQHVKELSSLRRRYFVWELREGGSFFGRWQQPRWICICVFE